MSKLLLTLAAAAAALAANPATSAQAWSVKGTSGDRTFVVVQKAQEADASALIQAAQAVCKPDRACLVQFWTDPALAPVKMPMSPAQQAGVVAQYSRNPTTGQEQLLFKCQSGAPKGQRCLK